MEQKGKEISVGERKLIIKFFLDGKSYREIGALVGRAHSSIQKVINNYNTTGSILSKTRSGRPPLLTHREQTTVIKSIRLNPRMTAHQVSLQIEESFSKTVSDDTVRRAIKKADYHSRVARKKPLISEVNRQKRITFANEYISKPQDFWSKIIFSDESKFCIFGIKGKVLVWRKSGEAFKKENLVGTVKHGGSGVMVWGCMAASGVGNLIFIDSIMNQGLYIEILKKNLKQSAAKLGLENEYWFQQDNDPKHTALNTKLWLVYNVKNQLRTPPQSPDLNPIEHLWDLLERKIRKHTITSKKMLKDVILEEWGNITAEETRKLVFSMPKRLTEVLQRTGYPTSY